MLPDEGSADDQNCFDLLIPVLVVVLTPLSKEPVASTIFDHADPAGHYGHLVGSRLFAGNLWLAV